MEDVPLPFLEAVLPADGPRHRVTILRDDIWQIVVYQDHDQPFEAWLFHGISEKDGIMLALGDSREQVLQRAAAELARLASVAWGGMR